MKKSKSKMLVIVAVLVIVGINLFWLGTQLWQRNSMGYSRGALLLKEAELEDNFRSCFADDLGDVFSKNNGKMAVYMGDGTGTEYYAIYLRIGNSWNRLEKGELKGEDATQKIEVPFGGGFVYISAYNLTVSKAVVTVGEETKEVALEAEKPLLLLVEEDTDKVQFFNSDGKELTDLAFVEK